MPLNRAQKLFIQLVGYQRSSKGMRRMSRRNTRRKKMFGAWNFTPTHTIKIQIISAITGEVTTAKAAESSVLKLKKWLRLRNVRAQFMDMVIKKNSIWSTLHINGWKDYPVIVKVGSLKVPYLIDHLGDKFLIKNRTVCVVYLRTVDNIDYLSIVNDRKENLKNLPQLTKGKGKKK